ncbi:16128_t:CDS:2 [Funneliformis geosporum]|uniref:9985_t:CDS:1 n=1 Tax=Funneliformis geosporum TaxID=1117311 RepID=A0A9W4WTW1_9GLOM|nr:9985_t:CDS:2 [Funneliformis geosporum]CAI2185568.1 16128_t:CDS:2 [Funneliformis geosporum]
MEKHIYELFKYLLEKRVLSDKSSNNAYNDPYIQENISYAKY